MKLSLATAVTTTMLVLSPITPTVEGAELSIDDAERAELIALLEDSQRQFEELTAAATGDDWSRSPAEEKWSVGEVAEHLVLAEAGVFAMAVGALEGEMDPEWQTIAAVQVSDLVANLKDRSQKFQAPEQFVPQGNKTREELLREFAELRARTLEYARTTTAKLKGYTVEGPAGKMNVHQWLALIGAHNLRHNAQIAEVRAMLAEQG